MLFSNAESIESQMQTTTPEQIKRVAEVPAAVPTISKAKEVSSDTVSIEREVRNYFRDTPQLVEVAWCESRFRHTGKDGNIFRGMVNSKDVGVMQVNEGYHLEKAKSLGFDIYTLKGNMAYAKYLFEREGLSPWQASRKCWGSALNSKEVASL